MPYYHKECEQNLGRKTHAGKQACGIMSYAKCLNSNGKYKKTKRCKTMARKLASIMYKRR